jgi:lipoprotein NlpI
MAGTNAHEALADFNRALALKPEAAGGYVDRGRLKRNLGDLTGALGDLDKAIALKADAFAYLNRGLVKGDLGDSAGAMNDFDQAIELNPKFAFPYRARGFEFYNRRNFTNAVADFRRACELDVKAQDYSHFGIWLARAHLGDQDGAARELETYFEQRTAGTPGDWPSTVAHFLTGHLSEADFFQAASNPNPKTDAGQHCEAYFYAGSKRLIEGGRKTAVDYFKKCLTTGVVNYTEYQCAAAELAALAAKP